MRFGDLQIALDLSGGYWIATASGIVRIYVDGPEWLPQAVAMWESQGALFTNEGRDWIKKQQAQRQDEERSITKR